MRSKILYFGTQDIIRYIGSSDIEERKKIQDIIVGLGIPISIFNSNLSGLESLVLYFKEIEKYNFYKIAKLLNRSYSTISSSYYNAIKKKKGQLDLYNRKVTIFPEIFFDRRYSILESLVAELKSRGFTLKNISRMINKSYTTVTTSYYRYKKKNEK
jgi:hypothetical protein